MPQSITLSWDEWEKTQRDMKRLRGLVEVYEKSAEQRELVVRKLGMSGIAFSEWLGSTTTRISSDTTITRCACGAEIKTVRVDGTDGTNGACVRCGLATPPPPPAASA